MTLLLTTVVVSVIWSRAIAENVWQEFDVTFRVGSYTNAWFRRPRLKMHPFSDVKTYHPHAVTCTHRAGQDVVFARWSCRDGRMPSSLAFDQRWTQVTCRLPDSGYVDKSTCYLEYAIKKKVSVGAIVGGVIGAVVLISIILHCIQSRRRRRRWLSSQTSYTAQQPTLQPVVMQPGSHVATAPQYHPGQTVPPPPTYCQAVNA